MIEELLAMLGEMGTAAGEAAESMGTAGVATNDLDKSVKKASNSIQKDFISAIVKAIDGLDKLAESTAKGDRSGEKYIEMMNDWGSSVFILNEAVKQNWSEMFKLAGITAIAGDHVKKYAAASIRQTDLLTKGYQSLSEFGAIDSTGLRGLLDSVKNVGATPETMQYLVQAIASTSEQLAMFGGTVQLGGARFTKMVAGLLDPTKDFERVLTNLGYSTEDITKYSASFIATNSRTLKGMTKDEESLKEQTNQYLETLAELSELTGVSRDKQKQAAEELQQEIQWRVYLRKLAKEPNGDKKVAAANTLMAQQLAQHGKPMVSVMQDFILHGAATRQATAQLGGAYYATAMTAKQVIESGGDVVEGVAKMNMQTQAGTSHYLDRMAYAASMSDQSAHELFVTSQMFDQAAMQTEDFSGAVKQHTENIKNQGDPLLNAQTKRHQTERALSNFYQELYFDINKYTIPALERFTWALEKEAKVINGLPPSFQGAHEFDKIDKATGNHELNQQQKELESKKSELDQKEIDLRKKINEQQSQEYKSAKQWNEIKQSQKELAETQKNKAKAEQELNEAKAKADKAKENNKSATNNNQLNAQVLNLKAGAINPNGSPIDPNLLAKSREFQKLHPNSTITAFTGGEHNTNSNHYRGKAMDISMGNGRYISQAEFDSMKKDLEKMGLNVDDERDRPTGKSGEHWTGPHLHVSEPDKPRDLNSKKTSLAAPNYDNNAQVAALNANQVGALNNTPTMFDNNKEVVAKLDNLERLFNRSLRVQEDILTHTKMAA